MFLSQLLQRFIVFHGFSFLYGGHVRPHVSPVFRSSSSAVQRCFLRHLSPPFVHLGVPIPRRCCHRDKRALSTWSATMQTSYRQGSLSASSTENPFPLSPRRNSGSSIVKGSVLSDYLFTITESCETQPSCFLIKHIPCQLFVFF